MKMPNNFAFLHLIRKIGEIIPYNRRDIGICDRRNGAFIFVHLRQYLRGNRDRDIRHNFLSDFADACFRLTVGIGVN